MAEVENPHIPPTEGGLLGLLRPRPSAEFGLVFLVGEDGTDLGLILIEVGETGKRGLPERLGAPEPVAHRGGPDGTEEEDAHENDRQHNDLE